MSEPRLARLTTPAAAGESRERALKAAQLDVASIQEKIKAYQAKITAGTASRDSAEYGQLNRDLDAARDQLDLARADLQEAEWKAAQPRPQEATPKSLRAAGPREVTPEMLDATRIEIDAMQKRLADMKQRVEVGVASPLDYQQLQAQFELLALRYREQLKTREANEATARETRALNERLIKSVEDEIALLTRWIDAAEKKVIKGYAPDSPELLKLRRDLLGLQRKLDELKADIKR